MPKTRRRKSAQSKSTIRRIEHYVANPIRRLERFTFAIPHAVALRYAWLAYVSHSENNPGEKTKAAALLAHWRKLRTEGPRRG
jgi:hypothetical protein